jgi:hypothetical protein
MSSEETRKNNLLALSDAYAELAQQPIPSSTS